MLGLVLFASCSQSSSDGASDNTAGNNVATTFMPLTNGNWWAYKVQGQVPPITRDSLYVKGDTLIGGTTFKKMKTRFAPTGFYSTTLRNNGIKVSGSSLIMSGSISISAGLPAPITFAATNFTFFKENASQNDLLSTQSGTFNQTIQGYPLTFDYVLKSYFDGSLPTFTTTTNRTYADLKKTKVVLNLKITYTQNVGGFPLTAVVLQPQDVVVSTQYYAKGKGMVYANTDINYTLSSVPGVTLPIPSSGSQNQKEFLDTFLVN